jgi:hypothetical protein
MSGKLLSLFNHPEYVRRSQARAERELTEQVAPVLSLGRGRFRCRRCSLDFDSPPPLCLATDAQALEPCPRCDNPPEFDAIEAFLEELLSQK